MKLGIFQKLLLMFVLVTCTAVGLVSGLMQISFSTGFARYLAESELKTIDNIPQSLAEEYKKNPNWKSIFGDKELIDEIIAKNEDMHDPRLLPLPSGSRGMHRPPGRLRIDPNRPGGPQSLTRPGGPTDRILPDRALSGGPTERTLPDRAPPDRPPPLEEAEPPQPPPYPPFRLDVFRRIGVFDMQSNLLWGNSTAKDSAASLPVTVDGAEVAQLKLAPSERAGLELEEGFIRKQSTNLLLASLLALAIAAISAILFSRHLVRAINSLLTMTHELIDGNYSSRSIAQSSDELGELNDNLNKLASTLEQHDRAHKQWVTDTSHELRTPVAILRAQVEALQDGVQDANPKTLSVLHNEVMTMSKMIDDLYDLARSDAKQVNYSFVRADISALIIEQYSLFAEKFAAKNIEVNLSSIKEFKCIIKVDPFKLKQLFQNLLQNSVRYTDEGGKLIISAKKETDHIELALDDTAPGVPAASIAKIFERFYRVESSRSREHGGSGLGLAICKTIVEGHGGEISASQSEYGGLRIDIKLPIRENGGYE